MAKKAEKAETPEPQGEAVTAPTTEPAPSKDFKKADTKTFPDYESAKAEFSALIKKLGKEGPKNKNRVRVRRRPAGHFDVITYVRP